MTEEQKAIIRRTADWLEANRDRHIKYSKAIKASGQECDASSPDAYCFCAAGRLAAEAGIRDRGFIGELLKHHLGLDQGQVSYIWRCNDDGGGAPSATRKVITLPNGATVDQGEPDVISYLREIAGPAPHSHSGIAA